MIHLIYHKKTYERGYKDYEFSATTMQEHWESGLTDIENTFRHPDWFMLPETDDIFVSHDIHEKRKRLAQTRSLLPTPSVSETLSNSDNKA